MTITSNPNEPEFYVYAKLDTRKPGKFKYKTFTFNFEPYYVGKGKGGRVAAHKLRSNQLVKNKMNKILRETGKPDRTIFLITDVIEDDAYALEEKAINDIGRKDQGKGPLLNLVNGGRGRQQMFVSQATKKRRAAAVKEHWGDLTEKEYRERTANMGRRAFTEEDRIAKSKEKLEMYSSKRGQVTKEKLRTARAKQDALYRANPEIKKAIYGKANATRRKNKEFKEWCAMFIG